MAPEIKLRIARARVNQRLIKRGDAATQTYVGTGQVNHATKLFG